MKTDLISLFICSNTFPISHEALPLIQKRFYTRRTLRNIRIPHWLISQPFIVIGWDPWIKKRVTYLSCIEGKVGLKDIHCSAEYAAIFVDLLWNIFYCNTWRIWLIRWTTLPPTERFIILNISTIKTYIYIL